MKKQTKEKGLGEANQNQTKERKKPNRSRATQQGKGLQGKPNCPIKWLGVRGKMNNSERARERGTRKKGKTAQTVGSSANDVISPIDTAFPSLFTLSLQYNRRARTPHAHTPTKTHAGSQQQQQKKRGLVGVNWRNAQSAKTKAQRQRTSKEMKTEEEKPSSGRWEVGGAKPRQRWAKRGWYPGEKCEPSQHALLTSCRII